MKKGVLFITLMAIATCTFAQNNPRPSRSRFWNNKFSTFQLKPGDILVYSVEQAGEKSDFLVTIKSFGETITYDYSIPQKNKQGTVTIPPAFVKSGAIYLNSLDTNLNELNGNDKGVLWLSQANFRGLASNSKQTRMDFGHGEKIYKRQGGSTMKINYKGREKIITIFDISSSDTASENNFQVLTDVDNPLIVRFGDKASVTLKEVR